MVEENHFTVIPIKFSSRVPHGSFHELFVKLDQSSDSEYLAKYRGKTLLVCNIPPWLGPDEIRALFLPIDPQHIFIRREAAFPQAFLDGDREISTGYKFAHVVFENKHDASEILTRNYKREISVHQDRGTELVGLRKMVNSYIRLYKPQEILEAAVSGALASYDRALEHEKKVAEKLQRPDEDGWITVSKHGKRPFIPRAEAVQARLLENERLKDKRRRLPDFYTFQAKRSKLNELEELRRKFGEDKQKVALLKMKRKFNG